MHNVRSYAIPACKGSHSVSFVQHGVQGHEHINLPTTAVWHSVASAQLTTGASCIATLLTLCSASPSLCCTQLEIPT